MAKPRPQEGGHASQEHQAQTLLLAAGPATDQAQDGEDQTDQAHDGGRRWQGRAEGTEDRGPHGGAEDRRPGPRKPATRVSFPPGTAPEPPTPVLPRSMDYLARALGRGVLRGKLRGRLGEGTGLGRTTLRRRHRKDGAGALRAMRSTSMRLAA